MVKIEHIEEPLDKQQTEVVPAVQKPPTMNTLIVEQMKEIGGLVSSLADIVTIKNVAIMALIIGVCNLACLIYLITAISILFGRTLP